MRQKIELYGCNHKCYVWREVNKAYEEKGNHLNHVIGSRSLLFGDM